MARSWATMSPELKKWGYRNVKALRRLGDYDIDDWLDTVGLRRNAPILNRAMTAAGLFFGGIALGVAAGMAAAPRSGRDLRRAIREARWKGANQNTRGQAAEAQSYSTTH